MDAIVLRAVRPLLWHGQRIEAGATIKASAFDAGELLSSGRAELLHAPDREAVLEAQRADIKRQLKSARGNLMPPPENWPWVPAA